MADIEDKLEAHAAIAPDEGEDTKEWIEIAVEFMDQAVDEIAVLQEENGRFRQALREIYERGLYDQQGAYKHGFYASFKTARKALGIPHMPFQEALAKFKGHR